MILKNVRTYLKELNIFISLNQKYSDKDIFIFSTRAQADEFLTKIQNSYL